jgi:protein phosphatase
VEPAVPLLVPRPCLVLLAGVAGCGKSTFAGRHFRSTEVVSSDACRALVADDPDDQRASGDAFSVLHLLVEKRLKRRHLVTAVDATNLHRRDRRPFVRRAQAVGMPVVAVVLDIPLDLCIERDRARPERHVGELTLRRQREALELGLEGLDEEGLYAAFVLRSEVEVDRAVVERVPFQPAEPLAPAVTMR